MEQIREFNTDSRDSEIGSTGIRMVDLINSIEFQWGGKVQGDK